ncbi:sarcoplasmic calcium-binding protein 1 isoform X1 [Neodiprion pinetum]|uniref:Sarcoplasmic calcium-binding protein 1 isoform X1 n=1 Tax=Neodiprion lecontei TaxID=441921 RepID=A0A6J0BQ17_NEOLC|nr:sarcoplasmic calcium-binding protein 1 isoform X1 [Neodiprion lecontei]XP_046427198.1 sarcoplasmic calcium-binding protein 1 isoform X1 [Neodiprion fabricii]XP_046488371.1 sarcoplasmic calcium-binding protein 1 isoform X1 [Neodiprion pinetum]XP_046488379.1 sarcoplasmic calcium-binding protein 1 isoform X1 [Neodiprion pinetum]XP_046596823.1 sarcoplasmic calcium-binding protein 1 isoform X1 [Neodiprion lecontei]XP_046620445.1 sarcoplasmic calcium-binding protein 1 isoform X1 [Neodiprion virgi
MAYSWDNRVSFIVKFLYDIDNNGVLDQHDFECMALKMTLVEGKGDFNYNHYQENLHVMLSLWEEIAELADFNKVEFDGVVTTEEFKVAVQRSCMGRPYRDFPQAMKMFIDSHFKLVDLNDDGVIAADEFRYNCVMRIPVDNIDALDDAYQSLLNDDDRRRGGLTLARYQELYAQFLGNPDENSPAVYLFGPLHELC